jgi:hypothetical protein
MPALLLVVLTLAASVSPQLPTPEAWVQADLATVRLDPDTFIGLPTPLRRELKRRGCTVPQTFTGRALQGVISGRFRSEKDVDWAVLCSRNRRSSILVFWGGSIDHVEELAPEPDASYLQQTGHGAIGFSRWIGVAGPSYIRRQHEKFGGHTPPPLDHDGIEDAFVEKASVVLYWHEGQWLKLTGAD